jgi:hypothetical protein
MAIMWTIESGIDVAPSRLLAEFERYAKVLTGGPAELISAAGQVGGHSWRCPPIDGGLDGNLPNPTFDIDVIAGAAGGRGQFSAVSNREIEDDGTAVSGDIYAEVIAHRTQISVVLGFAAAAAMLELSAGELTGTGVNGRYGHAAVSSLIRDLGAFNQSTRADLTQREAVMAMARRFGVDHLPLSSA